MHDKLTKTKIWLSSQITCFPPAKRQRTKFYIMVHWKNKFVSSVVRKWSFKLIDVNHFHVKILRVQAQLMYKGSKHIFIPKLYHLLF